jgi:hypothetical protein
MGSQDNILEQEHNEFVNSELFCQMIKEKIENSHYYKYDGIAPEGFILIPEQTLERLKDFDYWKEWIHDSTTFNKDMKEDTKNM